MVRFRFYTLVILVTWLGLPIEVGGQTIIQVPVTPENFSQVLAKYRRADGTLLGSRQLLLAPGHYYLTPSAYVDSTCGNCEDPHTVVQATVGLVISGQNLSISGADTTVAEDVVIHTGAGYGLLFEDCNSCRIDGVTITGGVRDPDARATDAAIVVKNSSVHIEDCIVRDNLGDSTLVAQTVVGIMGIVGRQDSYLTIRNNEILRNSWDGIALYRDAEAVISDNLIDGVDAATGDSVGGGRGVGIGMTWNAKAQVLRNRVTRYWKGIGIFLDAQATVEENLVTDVVTWGIAVWDAGRGQPVAEVTSNLVYGTGACGISIACSGEGLPAPGSCRENILVRTGLREKYDDPGDYCEQCPVAVQDRPENFVISDNLFFQNRHATGASCHPDLEAAAFYSAAMPLLKLLHAQLALHDADCFRVLRVPGSSSIYR